MAQQQASKQMASKIMDFSSEHWRMQVQLMSKPDICFRALQKQMSAIQKIHKVADSEIACVIICNWSAPSVLTAEGQRRQADLLASLVNRSESSNLGLLLTPSHSNKKGLLWKEEEKARGLLCQKHGNECNTDVHFVLTYGERLDMRETRTA